MVVVPNSLPGRADSPGWWVRSWDRTYKELEIADIKTPRDLEEVAEDAGAQLGSANTRDGAGANSDAVRKRELASVRKARSRASVRDAPTRARGGGRDRAPGEVAPSQPAARRVSGATLS